MPNHRQLIDAAADHVHRALSADASGHDWWHIHRVWRTACALQQQEGGDLVVIELAALLHDLDDWKLNPGDDTHGPRRAREWMQSREVEPATIEHVCQIITRLSFKGAGVEIELLSLEGQIVQDADRLDAIGAVGIARAFAFGGHAGRAMFDPDVTPMHHQSFEDYKKKSGPTINHFYEKLLLLKDRMNNATARRWAEERHSFMAEFLAQFFREWGFDVPPAWKVR